MDKDASRIFRLIRSEFSGGWTGDLIIADWRDTENNFASEVQVKSVESEEAGIKKVQEAFVLLGADGSRRQEGHAQRQTLRHQRVESIDGVASTLGEARSDPLWCAGSGSLQEEGGVADTAEADRGAMKARADIWSMSGECMYSHHAMPREQLYVPKESSFPSLLQYIDVDDLWNIDESWSGSTRFRILNKRPHQGYSRVDERLTKTQVTSRPETIWPGVLSSILKMCSKRKQSSNGKLKKYNKHMHAARQRRKIS